MQKHNISIHAMVRARIAKIQIRQNELKSTHT